MASKKQDTEDVVLGKKFPGEKFSTVRSAEEIAATNEENKKYDVENAVPIDAYFMKRRITDPVKKAMMEAYTKVRKATVEAFDEIFDKF